MSLRFYIYLYTLGLLFSLGSLSFILGMIKPTEAEWWMYALIYALIFCIFFVSIFFTSLCTRNKYRPYRVFAELIRDARRDGLIIGLLIISVLITNVFGILTWWNFLVLCGIAIITIILFEH